MEIKCLVVLGMNQITPNLPYKKCNIERHAKERGKTITACVKSIAMYILEIFFV